MGGAGTVDGRGPVGRAGTFDGQALRGGVGTADGRALRGGVGTADGRALRDEAGPVDRWSQVLKEEGLVVQGDRLGQTTLLGFVHDGVDWLGCGCNTRNTHQLFKGI